MGRRPGADEKWTMIMVDSSVWIDYFNGTTSMASEKLDSLLGARPIATGDLILIEGAICKIVFF